MHIDPAAIQAVYPSICYTCAHARRPASEENLQIGWVACAEYARRSIHSEQPNIDYIQEAQEVGEGWVDLRAAPFGKSSGILTNMQILTNQVTKCSAYANDTR